MDAQGNHGWIYASERLPTEKGCYLAVCLLKQDKKDKHYCYRTVQVDHECDGFVWLGNGGVAFPIVQYWYSMPMPKLPRVERDTILRLVDGWVLAPRPVRIRDEMAIQVQRDVAG